ncbi:hypothetical protein N9270_04800 [Akkermansiaceae bacterium]|nr:hypothetical protein [Akkermansiaceae bacterium]
MATAAGSILALDVSRGEYEGPIVIKKPITIDGRGHSIWSKKGPVVIIKSQGVVLKNLQVDVTGKQEKLTEIELCSLAVQPDAKPTLESVTVRGNVVGLEGEEGAWGYPTAVNMGSLKANVNHTFKLSLLVPVPCRFSCDISGVSILPGGVSGGSMAELTLKIDPLVAGTRLRGSILIKSGALVRRIAVGANVARVDNSAAIVGDGKTLWQPAPETAPPTEKSISSKPTKKVEAKKTKAKKSATKKSAKKKSNLPKGKKKEAKSGAGVPATAGKNSKQTHKKKSQIPAHLPEGPSKRQNKPVVPDDSDQAFRTKDTATLSSKPRSKKTNPINKKSGIPSDGAFAKVPVPPVEKTKPAEAPKKKTETSPPKPKNEASSSVAKEKTSKGATQTKSRSSSKAPRKPRKSSPIKGGFAGGAFQSKPKSSAEPSVKKEVANNPPAKTKPAKKEAPEAKTMSKKKEQGTKPPVKKKPAKRVQSKGLGSVWGEAKKKK